jgi:hypothetical protein
MAGLPWMRRESQLMNDNDWVYEKWQEINARANKAEADLNNAEEMAKQLLIDMEFLRIMFEEELL